MGQGPAFTGQEPRGQRATGQGPARQSYRHPEASVSHSTYLGIEVEDRRFDASVRLNGQPVGVANIGGRTTARATSRITRKDFTDRLGLPEDATNAQFLAALDERLAARQTAAAPSPEDALYARVTGQASNPHAPSADAADDALWARLFSKSAA